MGEYKQNDAIKMLRDKGLISSFSRKSYGRKCYWLLEWNPDKVRLTAAVGATQYQDASGNVPFGVQDELVRENVVIDVLLIFRDWDHFYRIPRDEFSEMEMTIKSDDRRYFQVNRQGCLCSANTKNPISLKRYKKALGMLL